MAADQQPDARGEGRPAGAAEEVEAATRRIGKALAEAMAGERPGVFHKEFWVGHVLDLAMADESFKVDLFRLIDVLPTLRTQEQISNHIREYLLRDGRELPSFMKAAIKAAAGGLGTGLAVRTFRNHVGEMAAQFIAGRDGPSARAALQQLRKAGCSFTVDVLGEATVSDVEADAYARRYLDLIDVLRHASADWPADERLDKDAAGPVPRVNVSLKVSSLAAHLDPVDTAGCVERLRARVWPVLEAAKDAGAFVNFDMEQWSLHEITYDLFEAACVDRRFRDWPHLGIVIQAYLHSAADDLERLRRVAAERGAPLTIRLVKGAYWDYEVVRARQNGYVCPVFLHKAETDAQYEALTSELLRDRETLRPAIATHNLRSMAHAIAQAEALGAGPDAYEFQSLFGMAEPERQALRDRGHRVRVYVPVGELLPGMGYLVRRLLENTANSGFLRLSHHEQADLDTLLAKPSPPTGPGEVGSVAVAGDDSAFENCPLTDFTRKDLRRDFASAVAAVSSSLPLDVPVVVGGEESRPDRVHERVCPSDTARVVARIHMAGSEQASEAVEAAAEAWPAWRDRPLEERAQLLEALADRLERDRIGLAALQMFEVGKPCAEADGDVVEAVDFCRYYARRARVELKAVKQGRKPGEENVLSYEGRGPAVIIAPWNFPMAILCGMSAAALVSGNPIVMKPSAQASAIAYELYRRMMEAGIPADAVQFVPGPGREIGPALVEHPLVAQIAFTGSKAVGLDIVRRAAVVQPGQPELKRVVCEMGGKNAVIVDRDADLDAAVKEVVKSAFGYAGQKCSACSRVLLVGDVYETFARRLAEAASSLHIGPAEDPRCDLPPVVDEAAYNRLNKIVAEPGPGAEPVFVGTAPQGGYFVAPAIFLVTDPAHALMHEELFGPVLALFRVDSFEEALATATNTEFALTGGVFSRTPSHLDAARARFRVGNLYINRGTTGAIVDRQPFGGFGMSGGGTKAGGPGYLLNFVQARTVTENTMRSGFTPDVTL